jgi:hypothetical protein
MFCNISCVLSKKFVDIINKKIKIKINIVIKKYLIIQIYVYFEIGPFFGRGAFLKGSRIGGALRPPGGFGSAGLSTTFNKIYFSAYIDKFLFLFKTDF